MPNETRKRKSQLPKLIRQYYADLADLAHQNVMYEMGTRPAFHALLAGAGKQAGWTLIAEHPKKVNGKTIRPDGTFKDHMNLVRGYWEAKDTDDNLDTEIEKKRKVGYPLNNIIFEDNSIAVLYQNGVRVLTADMKDEGKLAELLVDFFRHIEPEIEEFEQAVDEFKERVPDLAEGLKKKIEQAHKQNPQFKKAFADFFELCRASLNPNLSQAAVDEMLVQHILTERLIREIFDNPEFVRRNVIAAEVEKVMLAMTSQSFDRNTYLKDLDRFYIAIEHAARTMTDWSDKQYFLNTVYERFFQGYSVKLADTMGIVYTPQEIVDFMCTSVAEVLEKQFEKKLWSDDVYIIDPCTGTGNFIVNLMRRIPKAKLEDVYKNRLFANEIMLLPYYIAALNIEHAYYEQAGGYEGFEGLCFVDTLDLAKHAQSELGFMTAKNTERVRRQVSAPITVVVGNPPYNVGQAEDNDRNKNRPYDVVDGRIRDLYAKTSKATSVSKLIDAYVRFFRWASDRLGDRPGMVCFVTNNGFLDAYAFDGFRKAMLIEFDSIHHLNLRGNARTSGLRRQLEGGNIFDDMIRCGVGITLAAKGISDGSAGVFYHDVGDRLTSAAKKAFLKSVKSTAGVAWTRLNPDSAGNWLSAANEDEFRGYISTASKDTRAAKGDARNVIFKDYSLGIATHRDIVVYDFDHTRLKARVSELIEEYNIEVDRWKRAPATAKVDEFVRYDKIVWDRDLKADLKRGRYAAQTDDQFLSANYRPYCRRFLFFDRILNAEVYGFPDIIPDKKAEKENLTICLTGLASEKPFMSLLCRGPVDLHLVGAASGTQCLPLYVYTKVDDEQLRERRENITDWALDQFRTRYKDKKIDKLAIFHYVYGLMHHPRYREKFADNLKRELPRIPFAPDFNAFAEAGKKLASLHLDYEKQKEWELEFEETLDMRLSYRVEDKMRLSKDKTQLKVNPSLTLSGIPRDAFDYRLGNRSALEWVIDQYQVSTDPRSGITSDPNREDDKEYIVRLVGQVIRVSIETMKIINTLPPEFAPT